MLQIILTNIVLNIILFGIATASGITFWPFETWHQFSVVTLNLTGAVMLTIILYRFKPWLCLMYAVLAVAAVFVAYFGLCYIAAVAMGY